MLESESLEVDRYTTEISWNELKPQRKSQSMIVVVYGNWDELLVYQTSLF